MQSKDVGTGVVAVVGAEAGAVGDTQQLDGLRLIARARLVHPCGRDHQVLRGLPLLEAPVIAFRVIRTSGQGGRG